MPSFAQNLEKTLHNALQNATDRAHEYATLEHLLLALIDDEDAAEVMTACGVDLGELGNVVRQLHVHVVARQEGDAAWPAPVWGAGPPKRHAESDRLALVARLRHHLDSLSTP